MPGLSLRWTGLFSFMCPPPPDCLKSLGESRKVCTPLQGDNGFSILTEGTFTFKTVSPHRKCLQGYFRCIRCASRVFACNGVFRAHLGCLPAMVYSVRISGVCLQWCIRCASQVFACKGIFRVHLRCLPAMVYSVRISGVCLQGYFQGASQVFACKGVFRAHLRCLQLTGTVIGPVSA